MPRGGRISRRRTSVHGLPRPPTSRKMRRRSSGRLGLRKAGRITGWHERVGRGRLAVRDMAARWQRRVGELEPCQRILRSPADCHRWSPGMHGSCFSQRRNPRCSHLMGVAVPKDLGHWDTVCPSVRRWLGPLRGCAGAPLAHSASTCTPHAQVGHQEVPPGDLIA